MEDNKEIMKQYDVMFVGHLHGFGGAEKSMIKVANALSIRGLRVAIVTFDECIAPFDILDNVDVHFIKIESRRGIKRGFERYNKASFLLQKISSKIVIAFWFQLSIIFYLLSLKYKFKIYYSERGDPTDKEYLGLNGWMRKLVFPKMDGFIFQTRGAQSCFPESVVKKSIIIPNPVYIKYDDYVTTKKRLPIVVAVGRLTHQKNFKLLIKAFAEVVVKFPAVNLVIYGDGVMKEDLLLTINSLGMSKRIQLHEPVKDLFNEIKDSSVFVLPSLYEGMPNALMEAMALGVPSLSADCPPGGPAELIIEGYNGFLFKNNDENDLINKLEYMLSKPQEMELVGFRAKNICKTHSEEIVMNKWTDFVNKQLLCIR